MAIKTQRKIGWLLYAALLGIALPIHAKEQTAKIVAPWQGEGELFRVGPQAYQFIGTFEGIMYIESGDGELNTAIFVCPTTQDINAQDLSTEARGRCHIVGAAGNVFATFDCKGTVGDCKGNFNITEGTDEYQGISGSSDMHVRSAIGGLTLDMGSGSAIRTATGLAIWPNMKVNIPKMK